MNYIYSSLNNIVVGSAFVIATKIAENNLLYGIIAFILSYVCLDLHSYFDKKLGYPNNIFIK